MKEQKHYIRIMAAHSKSGVLFRNNTGTGYQEYNGVKRIIKFGLCKGSSDLIGWTEVEITEEMIGKKVAIFTAVEVKTENGKVSEEQQNFINNVIQAGGIAKIERL
jgi:hypothetical protein